MQGRQRQGGDIDVTLLAQGEQALNYLAGKSLVVRLQPGFHEPGHSRKKGGPMPLTWYEHQTSGIVDVADALGLEQGAYGTGLRLEGRVPLLHD
jgi:hypothetical protein